ncbi:MULTISPECIES: DEAD/DEAH box helicase [unclassified Sphingobacterium]|uniref:DEAD/DEAH box helicase n=1 Tax=unclassified Sphingobacterium TaxID=2609468 RepID=UPI0025D3AD20|nr:MULTISPECIES: DEAD/DEAH box helicase [unclassified Sphingobacterium]
MQITEQGKNYKIVFRYVPKLVEAVKQLPERRFDPIDKCWKVPVIYKDQVEMFAKAYGFRLGEDQEDEHIFTLPPMPDLRIEIPLKMEMFPYQRQGVAYNLEKNNVIVGDLPGLGKTCQAIATVVAKDLFPCLIICPSSLKINWQREWHMWTNKKALILDDRIRHTWDQYYHAGMADVFIVNFESLKKFFVSKIDKLEKGKALRINNIHFNKKKDLIQSLVVDEAHRVKEIKTQQTKFVKGLAVGKELKLLLTGTPIVNKPKDLISLLGILDQLPKFGGYQGFIKRYCDGPNQASNLRELGYKMKLNCFYQRAKKEVLNDLPDKTRQVVLCDITNSQEYADAEANLLNYLVRYKDADDDKLQRAIRGEIMVKIGILKNISARGKLKDVFDYVDDLMETGEKLILFAHLKEVVAAVKEKYPDCVSITGSDNADARQKAVDNFQNNPDVKLIICSLQAAGVGLTLTASSTVGFIEFPWTAALCDQAEDRAHRIGQKDNVNCIYFQGKNTIDEKIYAIIQAKRNISSAVTGSDDQIEESIVENIMNLFNQPVHETD